MKWSVLRRKIGTAALVAFRKTPGPIKRAVVRAATPSYTVGAVCVIKHEEQVLLLFQPHRTGWSLPGGLLERGEEPADAVRREVHEEAGLQIEPGDPIAVGVHASTQQVDVIYLVRAQHRPELSLATEARKAQWFHPDDLPETDLDTRRILQRVAHADDEPAPGRLIKEAE